MVVALVVGQERTLWRTWPWIETLNEMNARLAAVGKESVPVRIGAASTEILRWGSLSCWRGKEASMGAQEVRQ